MSTEAQPTKKKAKGRSSKVVDPSLLAAELAAARAEGKYPLTVIELARRCSCDPKEVLTSVKKDGSGISLVVATEDSPCALLEDALKLAEAESTMRFLSQRVEAKRTSTGKPIQSTPGDFIKVAGIHAGFKSTFQKTLMRLFDAMLLPTALQPLIALPLTIEAIASRLLGVINSQKSLSTSSYPVLSTRLGELAGVSSDGVKKALKNSHFKEHVVTCVALPEDDAKAVRIGLFKDITSIAIEQVAWVIESAVIATSLPAGKNKVAKPTTIFSASELADHFVKDKLHRAVFKTALLEIDDDHLVKKSIGKLMIKGESFYFRLCDVNPAGHRSQGHSSKFLDSKGASKIGNLTSAGSEQAHNKAQSFSAEIDAAFDRASARSGGRSFIKLADLRREIPNYDRTSFDLRLRELRLQGRYSLDSAQGGRVELTPEELAAGIQEGSSLLVYVTRTY